MRNFIFIWLLGISTLFFACQSSSKNQSENLNNTPADSLQESKKTLSKAEQIIQSAIQKHGGGKYKILRVSFDFRDKSYVLKHDKSGLFRYERLFEDDSLGKIHDVLTNEGLSRMVNGKVIQLEDKKSQAYQSSINSVMYFTLLPEGLLAEAVQSSYLGIDTLKGKAYHQIEVTFKQEGGGEDFQDVYMYWFHTQDSTLDYFAYSYEVNEGGIRFRAFANRQTVDGVVFQNYDNFEVAKDTPLTEIGKLWAEGKLKKLSEINNENIKVIEE